ncbi:MAG: 2Fe-2S iron-sulfur cluster binding domain-containing protein [Burkholderiales bacterium]|nr:2Fe-2S iron-sulfur cluster binding domain-containing protein [Burkholderiales bacterium]
MTAPPATRVPVVCIEPQGYRFEAPATLTLLEAAASAGVRLPRSCRNGTCRTCLCKLVSGNVSYRIEWPGVSREEQGEGWILPCVAVADTDLIIAAPDAEPAQPVHARDSRRSPHGF